MHSKRPASLANKEQRNIKPQASNYQSRKNNDYLQNGHVGSQRMQMNNRQTQSMVRDQHLSNNTCLTVMSTLQSAEKHCRGEDSMGKKAYGYYDKFNYGDKTKQELKSQLATQLLCLKASRDFFESDYPGKYKLPQSYDEKMLASQISRFKSSFEKMGEHDFARMCKDVESIVKGKTQRQNIYGINKNFQPQYSQEHKRIHNNNVVKSGMYASEAMMNQDKVAKLYSNQAELPTHVKFRQHKRHHP